MAATRTVRRAADPLVNIPLRVEQSVVDEVYSMALKQGKTGSAMFRALIRKALGRQP